MAKKKNNTFTAKKSAKKTPFKEAESDYSAHKPMFTFYYMKYGGPYCVSRCNRDHKADIAGQITALSQFTWNYINQQPRETYGHEQIPLKQFRTTNFPSEIVTPDVKSLMVFRYNGGGRLAGVRVHDIYHVILAGPDIYPHLH